MNDPRQVYLVGAGGHAKVVLALLQELGYSCAAIFDDDRRLHGRTVGGIPIVGATDSLQQYPIRPTIIAVGDNVARAALAVSLALPSLTLVHPRACVDPSAQLGPGTVVFAGAVVQADARIGKHAIINTSASVDHDCQIDDFVHLSPGVHLSGDVKIAEGVLVGIGASVTPGARIGRWTVVGAGAAVVRDLAEHVVATGVPARVQRHRREARMGDAAPKAPRIYLSPPHMGPDERALLLEAFDSNWIAPLGPQVDAFEREFAEKLGVAHAVALSSGTAALHLALRLLGVGPGDRVATSTLTFVASTNAIRYVGAQPLFIDSEPRTWNLDPELLAEELEAGAQTGRPIKAVLAVDVFGQCADFQAIRQLCRFYEVPLIEDAAEALGAMYQDRPAGTFGDIGCFSFNGNKIITTSGGGMLVTDRRDWAEQARFLATQARDPAPHYEHSQVGYNYRMSNLLAAVGRGQFRVLDDRVAARRANFAYYQQALSDLPEIQFMPEPDDCRSTRWLTCLLVSGPLSVGSWEEAEDGGDGKAEGGRRKAEGGRDGGTEDGGIGGLEYWNTGMLGQGDGGTDVGGQESGGRVVEWSESSAGERFGAGLTTPPEPTDRFGAGLTTPPEPTDRFGAGLTTPPEPTDRRSPGTQADSSHSTTHHSPLTTRPLDHPTTRPPDHSTTRPPDHSPREAIRLALEAENIEARPLWKPMHLQPVYAGCLVAGGQVSEALFRDGLCLPSGSSLTQRDLARVVQVIRRVVTATRHPVAETVAR